VHEDPQREKESSTIENEGWCGDARVLFQQLEGEHDPRLVRPSVESATIVERGEAHPPSKEEDSRERRTLRHHADDHASMLTRHVEE
jgi:hypothetical protein